LQLFTGGNMDFATGRHVDFDNGCKIDFATGRLTGREADGAGRIDTSAARTGTAYRTARGRSCDETRPAGLAATVPAESLALGIFRREYSAVRRTFFPRVNAG
jgi:hypothetical protein